MLSSRVRAALYICTLPRS